ncbi:prolyl oligopeptidase [Streptoalloteichus tenebrarius]|uniref:prolyl oligopeptidase n=1 Tax=Streptoalloteichus tenebrarius (strain ATCC 17920 / DSM 40477 / JCM 4838 / CBS 697.72 / NBRC 16177 / NCIMB 11028 / NRRL B-12390 / A12253. 1 / ISP 5477) TaxID=1933 RepID=A0ABT1HW76_STRSD|nr:prolyl oligopeptidase family serine peptidase [Streptoalloteichus tenebrarius]MCP2259732.1 prolyl oligopeptidase [Streptoalloteichus tenebrarius]BFF00713.1 prolyl oligopeptidase family serine peptidase [Streptoalloteichus tenebrarius]
MTDAPASDVTYPPAERLDLVEDLHGHPVADPYRWLEDPSDQRTAAWSAAQDELTRARLDALPGRERAAARLTELVSAGSVTVPLWRAGRAFFLRREPGQEHAVLYVREPDGVERALLDPMAMDPSGLTTLDSWAPSLEGRLLAYQVSVGGDEESRLSVLDIDTGELVEGPIDRCRYSDVAWLPGGEEYFYVRRLAPSLVPPDEEQFHRRVWRHRVGSDPDAEDVMVHGEGLHHTYYYGVRVSRDGRWLVVSGSKGTARRDAVWIADLAAADGPAPAMREVISDERDVRCGAWVERDGRLYLMTTLDAPRWRLCVADPATPGPEHWTELVAEEPDSVLDAVRWLPGTPDTGPRLAVLRTRHAVAEVHLHDPVSGERTETVALPGTGSLTGLTTVDDATDHSADVLWLGWTDFLTPPCVHRHRLGDEGTELVEAAPGAVPAPPLRTRQVEYASADGTVVRMFLITPTERPDQPRPAMLTGYGGFSLSQEPAYRPTALAWVAAGGVWALASLRGGGEEGEEWHQAGMRERKQNVFDDFHAAAEHLVATGWTTPERLAIVGGSNGGLLVGAALTQRPELYRAVVCSAPLLDMARYEKFLIGRIWHEEYGSADDPEALAWLLAYSPYHNVRPGVKYPSVLFTVFDSDSRVDPAHARKMCAALQHATAAHPDEHPVLLRRETDVGHSSRSVSRTVALAVDQLVFLADATGLDLERP